MPYKDKEKSREKHKIYAKRHYLKNKIYYIAKSLERRRKLAEFVRNYKKQKKCERCGESDWRCLSFHHKEPIKKEFNLSRVLTMGYSLERIKREIEKCKVLCENCHRKEDTK